MNLLDYQRAAIETAIYKGYLTTFREGKHYAALGLCSEAGECASIIKRQIRDGLDESIAREQVKLELGDVLWYIACLAEEFDLTLEEVAAANLAKLEKRKLEGKLQGSGGER